MKPLPLLLALITLPCMAETITLANGQRCTRLEDGRIVGCTAPTRADRDRDYAYPYSHRHYREPVMPDKPKSAGWTPKY